MREISILIVSEASIRVDRQLRAGGQRDRGAEGKRQAVDACDRQRVAIRIGIVVEKSAGRSKQQLVFRDTVVVVDGVWSWHPATPALSCASQNEGPLSGRSWTFIASELVGRAAALEEMD